jgi:hypothetical protein
MDFSINFRENPNLEKDLIFLAARTSSRKPELTGTNVRDRVILQSSGWIGEGETKYVRYVSYLVVIHMCANICVPQGKNSNKTSNSDGKASGLPPHASPAPRI